MDIYDQFSLFEQPSSLIARRSASLDWPDSARFPHNQTSSKVYTTIKADLEKAEHPLIITGFASLDYLIEFFGELTPSATTVRVLLGTEPYPGRKQDYAIDDPSFPEAVEQYWLDKGISLRLSSALVTLMESIREGRVQARYLDKLHAKIYLGDQAVTLGSSNFSASGLRLQQEANARFERQRDAKRFAEARQLAENYWSMGDDYNEQLLALLEKLLQIVPWEEALARACAELLEGEWAQAYLQGLNYEGTTPLWASQRQGIAQALWVLDNLGSVLVADATGSGKTRMGAHLLRALMDRIWSSGRVRKERPVLVCPPSVQESWQREAMECGLTLDIHSHGNLSNSRSRGAELTLDSVRRGQLLAIDEAHNFLNPGSNRTQGLLRNLADHVVLFTATPINRSTRDLLRLVDILGADNFDENSEVILRLSRLQETGGQELTEADIEILRREIQRFTVRRTKTMLNAMIDTLILRKIRGVANVSHLRA